MRGNQFRRPQLLANTPHCRIWTSHHTRTNSTTSTILLMFSHRKATTQVSPKLTCSIRRVKTTTSLNLTFNSRMVTFSQTRWCNRVSSNTTNKCIRAFLTLAWSTPRHARSPKIRMSNKCTSTSKTPVICLQTGQHIRTTNTSNPNRCTWTMNTT